MTLTIETRHMVTVYDNTYAGFRVQIRQQIVPFTYLLYKVNVSLDGIRAEEYSCLTYQAAIKRAEAVMRELAWEIN